jgi:glycyl-tRNA synthetase
MMKKKMTKTKTRRFRTPFCTVDHQTIEDQTVTIRHRDTMKQDRVAIADLKAIIENEVSMKTG